MCRCNAASVASFAVSTVGGDETAAFTPSVERRPGIAGSAGSRPMTQSWRGQRMAAIALSSASAVLCPVHVLILFKERMLYGQLPHGGSLPDGYEAQTLPIVNEQLERSGLRLAATLNAALR